DPRPVEVRFLVDGGVRGAFRRERSGHGSTLGRRSGVVRIPFLIMEIASGHAPALFTDRYELTMVAAALADGTADRDCVFEVFARRLPHGRRYGVLAGTGRLLDALPSFRFGDDELATLREQGLTDERLLDRLAGFSFSGD